MLRHEARIAQTKPTAAMDADQNWGIDDYLVFDDEPMAVHPAVAPPHFPSTVPAPAAVAVASHPLPHAAPPTAPTPALPARHPSVAHPPPDAARTKRRSPPPQHAPSHRRFTEVGGSKRRRANSLSPESSPSPPAARPPARPHGGALYTPPKHAAEAKRPAKGASHPNRHRAPKPAAPPREPSPQNGATNEEDEPAERRPPKGRAPEGHNRYRAPKPPPPPPPPPVPGTDFSGDAACCTAAELALAVAKVFTKSKVKDWKPTTPIVTIGQEAHLEIARELGWALTALMDAAAAAAFARNRKDRRARCHVQDIDVVAAAAQLGVTGIGHSDRAAGGVQRSRPDAFGLDDTPAAAPVVQPAVARRAGAGSGSVVSGAATSFAAPARDAVMLDYTPVARAPSTAPVVQPPSPKPAPKRDHRHPEARSPPSPKAPNGDHRHSEARSPKPAPKGHQFAQPEARAPQRKKDDGPPPESRLSADSLRRHEAGSVARSHVTGTSVSGSSYVSHRESAASASVVSSHRPATSRSPSPRRPQSERASTPVEKRRRADTPTGRGAASGKDPELLALMTFVADLEARQAGAPSVSELVKQGRGKDAKWIAEHARTPQTAFNAMRARGDPDPEGAIRQRAAEIARRFTQADRLYRGRLGGQMAILQQTHGEWASWKAPPPSARR